LQPFSPGEFACHGSPPPTRTSFPSISNVSENRRLLIRRLRCLERAMRQRVPLPRCLIGRRIGSIGQNPGWPKARAMRNSWRRSVSRIYVKIGFEKFAVVICWTNDKLSKIGAPPDRLPEACRGVRCDRADRPHLRTANHAAAYRGDVAAARRQRHVRDCGRLRQTCRWLRDRSVKFAGGDAGKGVRDVFAGAVRVEQRRCPAAQTRRPSAMSRMPAADDGEAGSSGAVRLEPR